MLINISNLKTEIDKLNSLVDKYEDIYLNMYNEFSNASFFWYDNNAKKFFKDTKLYKIKLKSTIDELKNYISIYKYIINSYGKLGRVIKYDLQQQERVVSSIKTYIEKLNEIIRLYNDLDLNNCEEVVDNINAEKEKLIKELEISNALLEDVIKFYKEVEQIEKTIKSRSARIKVEYVRENNISDYV